MPINHNVEVVLPADEADIRRFAEVVSQALFFPPMDLDAWVEREGADTIRVAKLQGEVIGGLTLQRMGQWFGGRSVPMVGVRCLGVAPERRVSGIATDLMRAALDEIHGDGIPLSTLYPATQMLYRRSGYEQAGARLRYRLSTRIFGPSDRTLEVRAIEAADHRVLSELYTERARLTSGNLDRNDWSWRRILDRPPWQKPAYGFLAARAGQPEGYLFYTQKAAHPEPSGEVEVIDFVATSADAAGRLLTLLADHRSMAEYVSWFGAPVDPFLYMLPEQLYETIERLDWMLRLVDVRAALEARGYPVGLQTELHLEVTDDVLKHNNGKIVLEVADGSARVREGGRGELRIGVRGLATLYTGHLSAYDLETSGSLDGPGTALAMAAAIFAGPAPWMPDIF